MKCPVCNKNLDTHSHGELIECVIEHGLTDKLKPGLNFQQAFAYGVAAGVLQNKHGQSSPDKSLTTLWFGSQKVETQDPVAEIYKMVLATKPPEKAKPSVFKLKKEETEDGSE